MDFLESLPKVELHAHLSGSVPIAFLQECCNSSQKDVNEDFGDLYNYFPVVQGILSSKELLSKALRRVLSEFRKDGVVYCELRSSPRAGQDYNKEEYLRIIVSIIQKEAPRLPLIAKLIVSIDRSKPIQDAQENLDLFLLLSKEFPTTIVGLDVSGNPTKGDMVAILALIEEKRRLQPFNITIHTGEEPSHNEIQEILKFKPDCIGHGVHVSPKEAMHIPWEICLTSNIVSKSVPCYEKHILKTVHEVGIPFGLSTDDFGLFKTSLLKEFEHMRTKIICFLFNKDIFNIAKRPIDFIFSDDAPKTMLRDLYKNWEIKHAQYLS
uniref:Adenosine deaminase-like protein n=1 Tax=Caligus clemensi TaxID=344056 RepID=C1C2K9_CALCM|nr:Adenosine deaminase-like protein [Caligus clemensi]